nr:metallophosphoesterase family protein [Candidatus Njordarchaeota archaeon]
MKILIVSDFHGNLNSARALISSNLASKGIGEIDAVVVCGDLSEFGSLDKGTAVLEEIQRGFENVFYVTGNHDPPSLMEYECKLSGRLQGKKISCLHGKAVKFHDVALVGLSGFFPPFYGKWDTEGSPITRDDEAELFLDKLITKAVNELAADPRRIVLVTHDPPFGACDLSVLTRTNAGSQGIRRIVLKWKPAAVCCGHIHEGKGIEKLGETLVVNPGSIYFRLAANLDIRNEGGAEAQLIKI